MEHPDNPKFLESSLPVFSNLMLAVIFAGSIGANLVVLVVFYRKPGLRTTANKFVINLMVINIVACLSLLPITLTVNNSASVNDYLIFAEQFSSVFCSSVIVCAVLLISIDQYFAVVNPLHYHHIISSWKGCLMIISSWGFSTLLAFFGVLQPDFEVSNHPSFQECTSISQKKGSENGSKVFMNISEVSESRENFYNLYRIAFSITYFTTAFVIPFGLITFIYYRICAAASGNTKRTRTSMIASEECDQALRDKFPSEKCEHDDKQNHLAMYKNLQKNDNHQPSSSSLQGNGQESSNPSLVVTRPSPPRPSNKSETLDTEKCECAKKDMQKEYDECRTFEENINRAQTEAEVPFLKPSLKNNQSFTKLSSLHIQFSNSIEKLNGNSNERRHSNIPLTVLDPEFENLSKTRSSSVQSNFYDISSRSPSSTRSTTTSFYIQSSRSSSLNSTSTRLPPSRASSIRSTSSYIVHNIRHRISNASLFRYREEARATRISAMVIVMALFCWLPFFIVFSLQYGICFEKYSNFTHYFDGFPEVLLLMSTIVSPFLFAFRNRQVKREIRKIFQFCPEYLKRDCSKSFYKHNFSLSLKSQTLHLFAERNKNGKSLEEIDRWHFGM